MANKPPVLGSLDFEEIKTSLIDYLKNQTIIKDYNYEGSAIRTLIDLMAYNTFYYAYYMNMVASEMFLDSAQRIDSIISLAKPLGYTVPGRRSARAKILVTGIVGTAGQVTSFPEGEIFYGLNEDGIQYVFRNLEAGTVFDSESLLEVTEGELVNDTSAISTFSFTAQKYYIFNENVDISTIRVKVNGAVWKLVGNIGSTFQVDDKIYFIERLSSGGYAIQFGIENSLGLSLAEDDVLEIRYMISSGKEGNDIYSFRAGSPIAYTQGNINIGVSCEECERSLGGLNEPNINLIKFLAPKWFSSQGRAVTKGDYMGLLLESNLIDDQNDVIIFGGDEIYPPKYGRVFVSVTNPAIDANAIINYLKDYSVITVLPEYVGPKITTYNLSFSFRYLNPVANNADKQNIVKNVRAAVQNNIVYNKFNTSFISTDIANTVSNLYDDISITGEDFSISLYQTNLQNEELSLNTGNPFNIKSLGSTTLTTPFFYNNQNIVLRIITTPTTNFNNVIPLRAFISGTDIEMPNNVNYGQININKGMIYIPRLFDSDLLGSYTVEIPMKLKNLVSVNNNINNVFIRKVDLI